jgi:uncharacterized protein YaiL (DUF2058 family)
MSDLRDQLRKAGLATEKQLRQAKHQERIHATEIGHKGLEAERRIEEERLRSEAQARKLADRARADERKRIERDEAAQARLAQLIRGGWIREATAGSRRFFFTTRSGRISYLDVSDIALRKLTSGSAAIIETCGHVRGEYCVVTDRAAAEIAQLRGEIVLFLARGGGSSSPAGV